MSTTAIRLRNLAEATLTNPLLGDPLLGYYVDSTGNEFPAIWVGNPDDDLIAQGLEVNIPRYPVSGDFVWGSLSTDRWEIRLIQRYYPKDSNGDPILPPGIPYENVIAAATDRLRNALPKCSHRFIDETQDSFAMAILTVPIPQKCPPTFSVDGRPALYVF